MIGRLNSLAARIALAGALIAGIVVGVVAAGVLSVGRATFEALMAQHGTPAAVSYEMFDASITRILIEASGVALIGAVVVAALVARQIERPLLDMARAAQMIATGSYEARAARPASRELALLADSFNQMAASLQDQERHRRDLIRNFAHELRTPLTNLHGYLQALRDGVVLASEGTYVSLQEEVDRLRRLSSSLDVLADGGRKTVHPIELDLVPILSALLELSRPAYQRRGLTVDVKMPQQLWVRTDPDALAQILGNLLQNAGLYTPDGGSVWMRALPERDFVTVSIANTGEGIPPDDLPHVFERFYRVDKSRDTAHGGAGIGLAVVKELVEANGGSVGVDSMAGLTRFWFSLPA